MHAHRKTDKYPSTCWLVHMGDLVCERQGVLERSQLTRRRRCIDTEGELTLFRDTLALTNKIATLPSGTNNMNQCPCTCVRGMGVRVAKMGCLQHATYSRS